MSTVYAHTLPCGTEISYTVTDHGKALLVEYPAGIDISRFDSIDAYPIDDIDADYGPTGPATAWGEEEGVVYEVWPKA